MMYGPTNPSDRGTLSGKRPPAIRVVPTLVRRHAQPSQRPDSYVPCPYRAMEVCSDTPNGVLASVVGLVGKRPELLASAGTPGRPEIDFGDR